jgi:hypothetical protein
MQFQPGSDSCVQLYQWSQRIMNMTVFWGAASTSETSANFYHTTRRNIPEDGCLHNHRRDNLKSQCIMLYSTHIQAYNSYILLYSCHIRCVMIHYILLSDMFNTLLSTYGSHPVRSKYFSYYVSLDKSLIACSRRGNRPTIVFYCVIHTLHMKGVQILSGAHIIRR